jgi:hypothetical protein
MHEVKAMRTLQFCQIGPVAGIGQCIESDDTILRVMTAPVMCKVGADKTGSTGDQ